MWSGFSVFGFTDLLAQQAQITSPSYEAKDIEDKRQHSLCKLPHMHLFLPKTDYRWDNIFVDFQNWGIILTYFLYTWLHSLYFSMFLCKLVRIRKQEQIQIFTTAMGLLKVPQVEQKYLDYILETKNQIKTQDFNERYYYQKMENCSLSQLLFTKKTS